MWLSVLGLAEAIWVLASIYRFSANDQIDAIELLLRERDLVVQDAETVAAALELFRERPALKFSDCLIFQLARKSGHLPLGTFDRGLVRVDGAQKL